MVLKAAKCNLHSERSSNWEGPFMVAKFVVGGYYKLINMDGKTNVEIIHENWLKEFDA